MEVGIVIPNSSDKKTRERDIFLFRETLWTTNGESGGGKAHEAPQFTRHRRLNESQQIASSGKFSSDRTIQEYVREIWNVKKCPVD
ncbi:MAG: glycogen/starch/alpha-glucan phosphorylase [Fuerstia sp.]|nr:glycogen/starch/alpha-glucan phosphorylase [Fuerstiella sp.]